jgi:hypothetical protein
MRLLFVSLFLFSILCVSCKKEKASTAIQPTTPNIEESLLAKAKNYFEANVLNGGPAPVGTLDLRQKLKKSPIWEKAYISVTAKQNVVAVPLKFERAMKFNAEGKELQLNQQSKLLIYEASDQKMKAEVVTYVPDKSCTPEKYSGIILVEDWAGNRINRFIYQDGKASRLIPNPPAAMNTIQSSDCVKVDWYLCDVDDDGNTSNCEYLYTEYFGACYEGHEPPGDSGGYTEYIELEKRKQVQWRVYYSPEQSTEIDAWDLLKGYNGSFIGINARGSMINWSSSWHYREDEHSGAYSGAGASSTVAGSVLYYGSNNTAFTVRETQNFYYADVF